MKKTKLFDNQLKPLAYSTIENNFVSITHSKYKMPFNTGVWDTRIYEDEHTELMGLIDSFFYIIDRSIEMEIISKSKKNITR